MPLLTADSTNIPSGTPDLKVLYDTLQQIDIIHQLIEASPTVLGFADSARSVRDVYKSGRIASLIGIEGLHQMCGSASVLRQLYRLGVRYITLCHDRNNQYVDSAVYSFVIKRPDCSLASLTNLQTDLSPRHLGLSPAGKDVVQEMQRLGM